MALLYVFFLVPASLIFIFNYIPMYGVLIAFKDYKISRGIWASPWNNFEHFKLVFEDPFFLRVLRNTLIISFLRIIFGFPAPILLAILINEVKGTAFKRTVQSVSYLPHFMSWVVLSSIIIEIVSPQRGMVGFIAAKLGRDAPVILANKQLFRPLLIVSGIWKEVGWGTIVYFAAITGINPELYESAVVDGANRFRRAIHITIPSIMYAVAILFILRLGGILSAGFDQIFNLYNPLVYEVADIIDTYVYRVALLNSQYGFGAAVGLFKNAVGLVLVLGTNAVVKRFSEYAIW